MFSLSESVNTILTGPIQRTDTPQIIAILLEDPKLDDGCTCPVAGEKLWKCGNKFKITSIFFQQNCIKKALNRGGRAPFILGSCFFSLSSPDRSPRS